MQSRKTSIFFSIPYLLALIVYIFSMLGCTVQVSPRLDTSLGMKAFDNMKAIEVRKASIALYFDPKLRNYTVHSKVKSGEFDFNLGEALCVKLIKAMAYKFKKIVLIDTPAYHGDTPVNALMRFELQDVDVNMEARSGFAKVAAKSYVRIALRAEIKDIEEQRTIWVGTTQAKETISHEEMGQMQYQEAGRGFAFAIDGAIDQAVGDLMNQMSKSQSLSDYLKRWEGQA